MLRSPLFRALAVTLALGSLAACDATGDMPTSKFTAAERAALMEYLPEPTGRRSQPGIETVAPQALAREVECPLVELDAQAPEALAEPCWQPPAPSNYALRFGPGATRFASTFLVIQDQTFRIALDVRPDDTSSIQTILGSTGGLRFQILPGGGVHFEVPGYLQDGTGLWTLTAPAGTVRAGRWQRIEASYNELLLRIAVDGVVVAQTVDYQESSAATVGPVTFAPQFTGGIDRPRFTTYEGVEVYHAATFDEGRGHYVGFTGLNGGNRRLYSPRWIARSRFVLDAPLANRADGDRF